MMFQKNQRPVASLKSFSKLAGLVVGIVGGLVLAGWIFNLQPLESVFPGLATMKANTALGFILSAFALWLANDERAGREKIWITRGCAVIVTVLGLLTFGEYILRQDLGIDQLIFKDLQTPEASYPGRMSLTTSLNFVLIGLSLFLVTRQNQHLGQFLALIAGSIAYVAMIGYIFDVQSLYRIGPYSSMALHTTLSFALLVVAIFCSRPQYALMKILTSDTLGGHVARSLLPVALGVPLALGWLRLWGQRLGFYDTAFGVALMVMSVTLVLGIVIWWTAGQVNRIDIRRQQVEVDLQYSEERYRNTLDSMLEGGQIIDFDWRYIYVNKAVARQGRQAAENMLGRTMMEVYPGIENTELFPVLRRCMKQRIPAQMENEFIYPDGSTSWFELSIQPVLEGIFILSIDVTERKKAEAQLRESEQKFSIIYEKAPFAGVLSRLPDGVIVNINEAFEKVFGYARQEVIGRTSLQLGINPDSEGRARITAELQERGSVRDLELQLVMKSGAARVFLVNIDLVGIGGQKYIFQTAQDITERKQAEAALQRAHDDLEIQVQERTAGLSQANALLQMLLDHTPDHIFFKDLRSRFIRNSRSQAKALGAKDPAEIVDKSDFDFFPHAQRAYEEEQEIIRSGKPLIGFEEWVVWPDGRETWVSTTKVPLRDQADQIVGTFGISRDITDRKQAEEALQKTTRQLEAANKELEAFSYSVSHDLRAPLRAIDGFSRILLEDYAPRLDAEAERYLKIVRTNAQQMAALIDDLLTFSRISRQSPELKPVQPADLVRQVLAGLQAEQEGRQVEISIGELPACRGDPALLKQVFVNLLANALKFTRKREVAHIDIGCKSSDGENVYFVRDNGAGFDMQYAQKLFGVFQRLHRADEFEGTGVGLAIVQRILHRHGGRIWAEAEVDHGAVFYFTLPAVQQVQAQPSPEEGEAPIIKRAKQLI